MDKKQVRKEVIQQLKIKSKDEQSKKNFEAKILQKLFASKEWKEAECIGVTLSMNLEFSTELIITQAWQEGKKVGVPKTFSERAMKFISYLPNTPTFFTKFGVEEPISNVIIEKANIDLLIVPGVAYNQQGYRIGFGGGFYDQYLSDYQGKTCSLAFQEQLREDWLPEAHDVAVHKIFTERI